MRCEYCHTRKATTKATGMWGSLRETIDVCAPCARTIGKSQAPQSEEGAQAEERRAERQAELGMAEVWAP